MSLDDRPSNEAGFKAIYEDNEGDVPLGGHLAQVLQEIEPLPEQTTKRDQ
jgi:hypothetical protein